MLVMKILSGNNMKKHRLLALILAVSSVGCQEEIEVCVGDSCDLLPMSFYACIETPKDSVSTKTILGGTPSDLYRSVLWECQDEVYVTNGTSSSKFVNTTEGISDVALLEGELAQATDYYAAYPYDMVKEYTSTGFTIELPSVQQYSDDGVDSGSFPMVAQCNDGVFNFKNLCGIFVLQLLGEQTILSISFSGKDIDGNPIEVSGKGTVSMTYADYPNLVLNEGSSTQVTLDCASGVTLNQEIPTTFHIVIPAGTYSTFNLKVMASDGSVMKIESSKALTIKRSTRTTTAALTYSGALNITDLNDSGKTANCYIVSEEGTYKFTPTKGNSNESIGSIASVEVLWESFGTDVTPYIGELIKNVKYADNVISFETSPNYKEGNAVIAAKDAAGTILWSWHIWLTDHPEEQVYANNAGIMMDRNLGATSATTGDVGALGLLFQWGRKDPFLGSSDISSSEEARSTGLWSLTESTASSGTIAYATENPMTFITYNRSNGDWYYTGDSSTDNTRWQSEKTVYDPCPSGWRIPDGGNWGIWKEAGFKTSSCNHEHKGILFGIEYSIPATWYPFAGQRSPTDGELISAGGVGAYYSVTPDGNSVCTFDISDYYVYTDLFRPDRAGGHSVRCLKECIPVYSEIVNLSEKGTSNCYIVSDVGVYKFDPVKGNSNESVGAISYVEVLWETFGTDKLPIAGDLIKNVKYADGVICFETSPKYKEGNAVIAAKDAAGTILWSWHIWLTDQPEEQEYYNNAGTMMDRNLGATSATPGDVGALGLLYQWGRKDPFLGSSSISGNNRANSTSVWPEAVSFYWNREDATISYITKNPMTLVRDWYFPSESAPCWEIEKDIYDPCPVGWRVPDEHIWSKATGSNDIADFKYDSTNRGMNFSGKFGSMQTIWYPASGSSRSTLEDVGVFGLYWSTKSYDDDTAGYLILTDDSKFYLSQLGKERAYSVRCLKESSVSKIPVYSETINLSEEGTANCYIVSDAGKYRFNASVKGNITEDIGTVAEAEVLWESFGTDVTPSIGDIIRNATYKDGYIEFETPSALAEGNAVIAAKDASGTILWSWHIWLTDQPEEHVYYNNAGTVMDRNLGATTATPGDVGALGLLYQWGRKDPFLGSSDISSAVEAKAAPLIRVGYTVWSSSSTGTIAYATEHPTTFICYNKINYDWYYTGDASTDDTRWQSEKTIYDPCPVGWRVPDGGENGVWAVASGNIYPYSGYPYDNIAESMNFTGTLGDALNIWYPAAGYRSSGENELSSVGYSGSYLSANSVDDDGQWAYGMFFSQYTDFGPAGEQHRSAGNSVRCLKE